MLQAEPALRPRMLDVREEWEWQLAHIADAQHLPMAQIPGRIQELDCYEAGGGDKGMLAVLERKNP